MNERINELLKQSRTEYWTQYTPSYDYEKLTELMVQECYVALFPALRDMISRGQAYDMIRQHFGVDK